jgi:hypothetical protein
MRHFITGSAPDPERVSELRDREQGRFWRECPRSVELGRRGLKSMPNGVPMSWFVSVYQQDPLYISYGAGAHIVDVDGHRYLDANVGDMSTFCGYAPPAVTEAIAARGPVHATCQGLSVGGGGVGTTIRAASLAVHSFGLITKRSSSRLR